MHGGQNLDLVRGNIKTKLQPVQRVLDVIQEPSAANLSLVKYLFHASAFLYQAVEVRNVPIRGFVDELRFRRRTRRAKRGKSDGSLSKKASSGDECHGRSCVFFSQKQSTQS
jgi:hypothetical protein